MRLVGIRVGRLFWEATGGAKGDRSIGSNLTTTSDPSPETFAFEAFSSLPARALLAMAIRSPPPEKAQVRPFRSRVFLLPFPVSVSVWLTPISLGRRPRLHQSCLSSLPPRTSEAAAPGAPVAHGPYLAMGRLVSCPGSPTVSCGIRVTRGSLQRIAMLPRFFMIHCACTLPGTLVAILSRDLQTLEA